LNIASSFLCLSDIYLSPYYNAKSRGRNSQKNGGFSEKVTKDYKKAASERFIGRKTFMK
jgi:hypothetical protein